MWHYSINTASIYNASLKSFDGQLFLVTQPIAVRALLTSITAEPLPDPFNTYSVLVIANPAGADFNIYCESQLVSVNTVCWSAFKQQPVWKTVEEQYLELTQKYGHLTIHPLRRPIGFPWLTTLTLHHPKVLAAWLNDFSQCLSLALVKAERANSG